MGRASITRGADTEPVASPPSPGAVLSAHSDGGVAVDVCPANHRHVPQQRECSERRFPRVYRLASYAEKSEAIATEVLFDLQQRSGSVAIHHAVIGARDPERAFWLAESVLTAGLGMGRRLGFSSGNMSDGAIGAPAVSLGVDAVSDITLDGILRAAGIPIRPVVSGLLALEDHRPYRFTTLVDPSAITLDPMVVFIKGRMTRVSDAAARGAGVIGAEVREIPAVALARAKMILTALVGKGIVSLLAIGAPGRPVVDVPISAGMAGILVPSGLNPVAAMVEHGACDPLRFDIALSEWRELSLVF